MVYRTHKRRRQKRYNRTTRKHKRKQKQRGGVFSNFLIQDLINMGRNASVSSGNEYNSLAGYKQAVNPLPWKDQYI